MKESNKNEKSSFLSKLEKITTLSGIKSEIRRERGILSERNKNIAKMITPQKIKHNS